ncbi:MAG: hypothetical protein FD174_4210 [Geobacteraceae bacterium]|nr:MAG: hypothetical protein FD174_4210 [Geobacteraceae bacterium]
MVFADRKQAGPINESGQPKLIWLYFPITMMLLSLHGTGYAQASSEEETVCGFLKERFYFNIWRKAAGKPDIRRVSGIPAIEAISFTTRDGRKLHGYKLRNSAVLPSPKGYILVAQGNAMLADQIAGSLQFLARYGYDVYIYDYRGYGNSQGNPRLKAILGDYREIASRLNAAGYPKKLLYGISFGGMVLLNCIGSGVTFDAAVIDSAPSRLSVYGCPEQYDSVTILPKECSNLKIIVGELDSVLAMNEMEELLITAQKRGAEVLRGSDYAHPFMDSPPVHERRMQEVARFLFERAE